MKPKYIIIILAVVTVITVFYSCKDNPVKPPPVKSPRDYTWTVDTLNIPDAFQNLMRSMYAANAEDIYLIGHTSGGIGDMWHYNGKKWSVVDLGKYINCVGSLYGIHGTSSNNIWVVGEDCKNYKYKYRIPLILQYNGVTWKKHLIKQKNGLYGPLSHNEIYSVFVESETNVWACGAGGLVYHYDGNSWDIDTIKVELKNDDFFQLISIVVNNNKPYVLGTKVIKNGIELKHYFLSKVDGNWITIDTFIRNHQNLTSKWGTYKLYSSKFGSLYSYGVGGLFKWNGTNWVKILTVDASIDGLYAYTANNILAVGANSIAYYFNGNRWDKVTLPISSDVYLCGVWQDDKTTFIIGQLLNNYPMKTIVLQGK